MSQGRHNPAQRQVIGNSGYTSNSADCDDAPFVMIEMQVVVVEMRRVVMFCKAVRAASPVRGCAGRFG